MQSKAPLFTPVLLVGCFIIVVSFAVRASLGYSKSRLPMDLVGCVRNFHWPSQFKTLLGELVNRFLGPSPNVSVIARPLFWAR